MSMSEKILKSINSSMRSGMKTVSLYVAKFNLQLVSLDLMETKRRKCKTGLRNTNAFRKDVDQ